MIVIKLSYVCDVLSAQLHHNGKDVKVEEADPMLHIEIALASCIGRWFRNYSRHSNILGDQLPEITVERIFNPSECFLINVFCLECNIEKLKPIIAELENNGCYAMNILNVPKKIQLKLMTTP